MCMKFYNKSEFNIIDNSYHVIFMVIYPTPSYESKKWIKERNHMVTFLLIILNTKM